MKSGQGFVLVYSITSQATFNDMIDIKDQIMRVKDIGTAIPMVLVGNKSDLEDERVVGKHQGESLAHSFNCTFLEASAKLEINVNEVGNFHFEFVVLIYFYIKIFFDLIRQINRQTQRIKPAKQTLAHDRVCIRRHNDYDYNYNGSSYNNKRQSGHIKDRCVLL